MAAVAPQVDPHSVAGVQRRRAADAGHLAAAVGQTGVIEGGQALAVPVEGALGAAVERHVHGEVVEAGQRAGEDAQLLVVGVALVEQHVGQLQDPRVVGGAVGRVQLGREGHHPPCGSSEITSFTRIRHVLQILMRGMGRLYCRHASLSAFTQQGNIEKIEKIVCFF